MMFVRVPVLFPPITAASTPDGGSTFGDHSHPYTSRCVPTPATVSVTPPSREDRPLLR